MFGNFLIGLREGMEATLIVVLLMAYLTKTGRTHLKKLVWGGIVVAIVVSVAFGALLTFGPRGLTFEAQEAIGGSLSIIAVGMITWMLFWMVKASKNMSSHVAQRVDAASERGTAWAFVALGALTVGREGLETMLFLWAAARGTQETWEPLSGALLGIGLAVLLGVLLNRGAVRLNLGAFFKWTALFLVFVAAGILAYAVHDLQEARILPGLNTLAFDFSETLPAGGLVATIIKAIFNLSPAMTVLEVSVWILYVAVVLPLYLRRLRSKQVGSGAARSDAAAAASADGTPAASGERADQAAVAPSGTASPQAQTPSSPNHHQGAPNHGTLLTRSKH